MNSKPKLERQAADLWIARWRGRRGHRLAVEVARHRVPGAGYTYEMTMLHPALGNVSFLSVPGPFGGVVREFNRLIAGKPRRLVKAVLPPAMLAAI